MAKKDSPDYSTRIQPGERRNPHGRPRKAQKAAAGSSYDVLLDRQVTVTLGGVERDVPIHEALQRRTLQAAFDGGRMAIRTVLKWIKKREEARPAPLRHLPIIKVEYPATSTANAALLLLGIAREVQDRKGEDGELFLQLEPWAVTAALSRPMRKRPSAKDIAAVQARTRDAESVTWPRSRDDD